jgi:hypothetical protein
VLGFGGAGSEVDRVTGADRAGTDDPRVEREFVAEAVPDAAEHVEVLGARVWVDGGDDAALPDRVDPDDRVADDECVAGPLLFGVGRDVADEQVGP